MKTLAIIALFLLGCAPAMALKPNYLPCRSYNGPFTIIEKVKDWQSGTYSATPVLTYSGSRDVYYFVVRETDGTQCLLAVTSMDYDYYHAGDSFR